MRGILRWTVVATVAACVLAPAALAHVSVNPGVAEADSFARFAVRVPNEQPDAATVEVSMQIPEGVAFLSFQPLPGWERTVETEPVAETTTEEAAAGEESAHEEPEARIASVTWSGGRIEPGEFQEFGISMKLPATPGEALVFPTTQTYSTGEVVRWIGAADADEPAPRVSLVAASGAEAVPVAADDPAPPASSGDEDGGSGLALGIGIGALVVALGALGLAMTARRGRTAA